VTDTPSRVTTGEIADLLAWARRLTEQGHTADPAERACYQKIQTDLLGRITGNPIATRGGRA
jgi:hypothetical protein